MYIVNIQTGSLFFWRRPAFNTSLFNTIGLHQGWEKPMQLEFGTYYSNSTRFHPSLAYFQLNSYGNKDGQIHSMGIGELMHVSTMWLLYLQVGNCNQTTYQGPNCGNATQLVQPKQPLVCPITQTATKQPINNYTVTMQPTHLVQPKHQNQVCPTPLVCMNVGTKSCS